MIDFPVSKRRGRAIDAWTWEKAPALSQSIQETQESIVSCEWFLDVQGVPTELVSSLLSAKTSMVQLLKATQHCGRGTTVRTCFFPTGPR